LDKRDAIEFFSISWWEQMNWNLKAIEIQKDIKKKFELSEETEQKRKSTGDDNPQARKKNLTNKEREQAQQALNKFVATNKLLPTADQENIKEHNGSRN
jgi:hypothetical protein